MITSTGNTACETNMHMKFTKIPTNVLAEKLEVENAMHSGKRYEVRIERKGVNVRAFAAHKPYGKVKDLDYFVWDLINNCRV